VSHPFIKNTKRKDIFFNLSAIFLEELGLLKNKYCRDEARSHDRETKY
jgi:hypothetical protein